MPIVGILIEDVISFAKDFSTHSNTIENTPKDSKIFASFKILFLSAIFFPLDLNFPFSDWVIFLNDPLLEFYFL